MVRRLISLPFLTMTAWGLTLAWLLGDERFQLFLAPKFKVLIYAGAALSLAFALGAAAQPGRKQRDHLLKGLFLLLPVLFIFSAGDTTLGNFALSKRGVSPVQTEASPSVSPGESSQPGTDPAFPQTGDKSAASNDTSPSLISISRLVRESQHFEGKRVSLEGLFSQTVVGHDELSAVFRYLITCCAADAMPVGVFTDRQNIQGITDDTWVRITGTVHRTRLDGFDILVIKEAVIEKRERPSKNAVYIFG